jgi:hypothetical protein
MKHDGKWSKILGISIILFSVLGIATFACASSAPAGPTFGEYRPLNGGTSSGEL